MDFDIISYDDLKEADFILPLTLQPYLSGTKNPKPVFYLGLPGWNYKESERKKNGPDPQPGTLAFYTKHFNATELEATYNTLPSAETVNKWFNAADRSGFHFCPNLNKSIADGIAGIHKLGPTKDFINRVSGLKNKLGTGFLRLKESFSAEGRDALVKYLQALPEDFGLSLDLLHTDWYSNEAILENFIPKLNALNKGLVITDAPGRQNMMQLRLSNSTAFIRFYCRGFHELDLFRIEQWKKQLQSWYRQGLDKCYFFLHIREEAGQDDFIQYVREELSF